MFLTSGGTEAWIYTGQKKKPHAEKKFCLVNSEDQQTPLLRLISGFNSSLSPIPQSRLHGRVLHMPQSTSTHGSLSPLSWGFRIWILLSLQGWLHPYAKARQNIFKVVSPNLPQSTISVYLRSTFIKKLSAPLDFKRSDSTVLRSMKSCWKTMLHSAGNIFMHALMQCLKLNETHSEAI